jgi:hypothetical protein
MFACQQRTGVGRIVDLARTGECGSQAALSCSATAERPDQAELETLSGSMRNRKSRAHARFFGYFSGKYQN